MQLQNLIMAAYGVGRGQVSALQSLESALANRYDLIAKVSHHVEKEQLLQMVQRLLAERFKIALHRESKSMPVYALVVVAGGTKMKQVPDEGQESGCDRSFAQTPGVSLAADCHCMRVGDIAAALTAYAKEEKADAGLHSYRPRRNEAGGQLTASRKRRAEVD